MPASAARARGATRAARFWEPRAPSVLEDLLHLGLVLAVGEVLVEPERVLAIEDAVLEDGDRRELALAVHDVIDEDAGHRGGEPLPGGGGAQEVQLGLVAGLFIDRLDELAEG